MFVTPHLIRRLGPRPKLLADAGYTTILVGRWMHQTPKEEPYAYQNEIRGSTHIDNDGYD